MYSYDYMMEEEIMEFMEEFGVAILGVLLGVLLVVLAVAVVMYVLQSLGLYTIAKRRAIKHAWLAWLPIGCYWIAGSIADQYQYVAKGKIKNKRKVLLCLSLAPTVMGLIINILSAILVMAAQTSEDIMAINSMIMVIRTLVNAGVSIALTVFWHMALYDLYSSANPEHNVLFVVLGIFFGITVPFFIFCNRKKDGGMPPRKPDPQTYIPQEPLYTEPQHTEPQRVQEPWEGPEQL